MNEACERQAPAAQQACVRPMRWDYEAATPWGAVGLALHPSSAGAPQGAAQAALRLQSLAPWLDEVDAWLSVGVGRPLHEGLDWIWRRSAAASAAPAAVWACEPGALGEGGRLALPWPLLRRLPAPPASTRQVASAWEPVAAECLLATLDLSDAEEAALEPGGLLLLPASFAPGWQAGLRAVGEAAASGRAMRWRGAAGLWPADGRVCIGPPGDWQVRAPLAQAVDPGIVLGWWPGEGGLGPATAVTLLRADGMAGRRLRQAHGRLAPWGAGLGLHIEIVEPPHAPPV